MKHRPKVIGEDLSKMKKILFLGLSSVLLAGCSHENLFRSLGLMQKEPTVTPTIEAEKDKAGEILTVVLISQNSSGQDGVATLQEVNGQVKVIVATKSLGSTPQPAHIHVGSCPNPGAVKYPLTNVVNGKSETNLDIEMSEILKGQMAINIHKSATGAKVYTACGDVK